MKMNDQNITLKRYILLTLLLVIVLVVGFVSRNLILGEEVVKLEPAKPLYGQISQTLLVGTGGNKILSANTYSLSSPVYLDNNQWVVVRFEPPNGQGDNGYVLLTKIGPFYQVVLGPGTVFPNNITGLPTTVSQYLNSQGLTGSDSD